MNKLIDHYKRQINYLRISITEDILSYEEIVHIVRIALKEGITKIRVTGGEPLVRKGVIDLIGWLSQLEGIEDLSMTTNGILLSEFAQSLYQAGLKRVNVSMDSLKPELFKKITRGGELSRVWEGIEMASKIGLNPIKINVVAIKGFNEDEIMDFARLTFDHDYQIRFIEFMPMGPRNDWQQEGYLSCLNIRKIIEKGYKLSPISNKKSTSGPAELYRLEAAKGIIGFINPVSSHFCSSCNRFRLTADGKLRPCLFSDEEIDIKMALRRGDKDESLRSLLHLALSNKPRSHTIKDPSFRKCAREMIKIGG